MAQQAPRNLEPYVLDTQVSKRLLSPALVIYMDQVRHNIGAILAQLGGNPDRWRPHVKTIKIPAIQAELVRAGIRNFKCATPREADCLAQVLEDGDAQGADILVAYPLAGPNLERLAEVAQAHPTVQFAILVESLESVSAIPDHLNLFLDINPGMNRTGVALADTSRLRQIAHEAGSRLRGLHAYDGHRHEKDLSIRHRNLEANYAQLAELVRHLQEDGLRVDEIITAGTPAFLHAAQSMSLASVPGTVHRVSPGTVVLHDLRSAEENPGLDLQPAALLFSRVVSHPVDGIVTCDAGSKSLAAEAGDPCAEVLGHPQLQAQAPSEEHLPLEVLSGTPPGRGTELLLMPRHVCPTVNLAEYALLVERGKEARPVSVVARAHELLLGNVSSASIR